jgi:hypothetical protein
MDISELLAFSVKNKASDLHLSAGLPPMIRVHGDVRRINLPPLEHKDVHGMIYDIMNDSQRKQYDENLETDFSFDLPGLARFRVNAFNQDRGAAAVLRTIPSRVLSLEELQCPRQFADFSLGFVVAMPLNHIFGAATGEYAQGSTLLGFLCFRHHLTFQNFRIRQPAFGCYFQQRVVWNAAPEEEGQSRGQFDIAQPLNRGRARTVPLNSEDELGIHQQALQAELNARLETAIRLGASPARVKGH